MTTEKQFLANIQNAQFSTGPTTAAGKATVSINAIRHGIFTKGLIFNLGAEQESEEEYREMLHNLGDSLCASNQLESLLVEKIAVDFWRLRRTLKFETGSIAENTQSMLKQSYSYGRPNNEEIDKTISQKEALLKWNVSYIECLQRREVTFDEPEWKGEKITSTIIDDLYMIAKEIPSLTKAQKERLYQWDGYTFHELLDLLKKNGYAEPETITLKLLELFSKQNRHLEEEIAKLKAQKEENKHSEKLLHLIGSIPQTENADKVLKYERSLQKSIYQNLIMLKKLQGFF